MSTSPPPQPDRVDAREMRIHNNGGVSQVFSGGNSIASFDRESDAQLFVRAEAMEKVLEDARLIVPQAPCLCGMDFICTRCLVIAEIAAALSSLPGERNK